MNWRLLFPLYLGAAIGPMGGIGIVTLLPVLSETWSVSFATASLAITFYMVPFIVVQTFSGSVAQLFDARKALLFGFAVYALGGALCGLSSGLWTLFGSRIVQGVGAAFLTPIIMALIGELVPENRVGRAIGLLGMAYTLGVTLGPLFSGFAEVRLGWQWFFYLLSAVALGAGLLFWFTRDEAPRETGANADLFSVVPLMRDAWRQPGVRLLSFAAFSLFVAYIGIMTFTAGHLKAELRLPSDHLGTLLSSTGLSGIVVSPIAGYLGDRFGRRRIFALSVAVAGSGIALMMTVAYSYSAYLGLFLLLGTGAAAAWTTLNTMAVQLSPHLRKPVTSVYNAVKFSGYALAPVLLSFLYGPFRLQGARWGCLAALALSLALVLAAGGGEVATVRLAGDETLSRPE